MSFRDRVAIVTGAASGIGEATAHLLAADGVNVVVADASERGQVVVDTIVSEGGRAVFRHTDVSSEAESLAVVEFARDTFGGVHYAVNNAAITHPPIALHEMDAATFDQVIGVNLKGVVFGMQAQIRYFLSSGGGAIVNTSSGAGMKVAPGQPAYSISTAGIIQATRQAALEYAPENIRVNYVAPGAIDTPLLGEQAPAVHEYFTSQQPGGALGRPIDVAHAIRWLLSDEAALVTGVVHFVDSGEAQG